MTDVEPVVPEFASTGRTGRRNAMPDILGSNAGAGAADISDKLAELSVIGDDPEEGGEGSSSSPAKTPSEEEGKAEGT